MNTDRRAHGPTVLAIRQARRLTMRTVADSAHITPGYLSKIERGVRRPEQDITARLATALLVDPEHLTGQRPVIAILRAVLDITADTLADDVHLTTDELIAIETGAALPDPDTLTRIAVRLGINRAALDTRLTPA